MSHIVFKGEIKVWSFSTDCWK